MKILQNSGVPIYKQIAEQFEADIREFTRRASICRRYVDWQKI